MIESFPDHFFFFVVPFSSMNSCQIIASYLFTVQLFCTHFSSYCPGGIYFLVIQVLHMFRNRNTFKNKTRVSCSCHFTYINLYILQNGDHHKNKSACKLCKFREASLKWSIRRIRRHRLSLRRLRNSLHIFLVLLCEEICPDQHGPQHNSYGWVFIFPSKRATYLNGQLPDRLIGYILCFQENKYICTMKCNYSIWKRYTQYVQKVKHQTTKNSNVN